MIAVVAALQDEITPLLQRVQAEQLAEVGGSPVRLAKAEGREFILAQSGPGRTRAQLVGNYLIKNHPLTSLISIGFCGAVREGPKPGDIVVGDASCAQGIDRIYACHLSLIAAAKSAMESHNVLHLTGALMTAAVIVGEPEAKAEVGRTSPDVVAVDMETYWLSEIAHAHDVPFGIMRVILDDVTDWVPDVSLVDETGVVQRAKAMGYLMQHPNRAPAMIKLGSSVPKASASLASAVLQLVEQISTVREPS